MKKFLALVLALAMVLSLGVMACADDHEEVTIEVWIAQPDWADAWDEMMDRFMEQYPWITIDSVGLGATGTEFITGRMAANDLPDVIQQNRNQTMDEMVAQGMLTDISAYDCAKYMPDTYKDAYAYDGKLYGMCQGAAFSAFFYNMDILKEAGWEKQPENFDELLQCCADIKEKTGVAPLTVAAGKTTTSWMLFELVLANWADDFDKAAYEEGFKNGTFDFAAYPAVAEKLEAIAPYFLEGTASAQEEDVATYMATGTAAMCIAGNWNGGMICTGMEESGYTPAASLPPFGKAGEPTWISISPEDAFCVTENTNRTAAEQEAVDTFFNWVFEAENFALIQNARGTVPVTTNMTEEFIKLPEAMIPVVPQMGPAPGIKMGFNFWVAEFKDAACAKIQGIITGDNTAQDCVDTMAAMVKEYHK